MSVSRIHRSSHGAAAACGGGMSVCRHCCGLLLLQHLWREASGRRFRSHLLLPLLLLLHLVPKLHHLWRHSGWRFDRQVPFRKQTCAIAYVRERGHRRTRHGNAAIGARPSERPQDDTYGNRLREL